MEFRLITLPYYTFLSIFSLFVYENIQIWSRPLDVIWSKLMLEILAQPSVQVFSLNGTPPTRQLTKNTFLCLKVAQYSWATALFNCQNNLQMYSK